MLNTKCFCRRWTLLHFMGKLGKLIAAGWMNSCFLILWSWDSVKWRPQGPTGDVEFKLKWISERKRDGASQNQTCCFEFVCIHDVGSAVCRALFHEASVKQADVIKCKKTRRIPQPWVLFQTPETAVFFSELCYHSAVCCWGWSPCTTIICVLWHSLVYSTAKSYCRYEKEEI